MLAFPTAVDIPLRTDKDGAIRIANTRVTLEIVISAYQRGDSPEEIVRGFDVLKLDDVYAVITYYLRNREEVDEYIQRVDADAEEIRRKFEELNPVPLTREILLERLEVKKKAQG